MTKDNIKGTGKTTLTIKYNKKTYKLKLTVIPHMWVQDYSITPGELMFLRPMYYYCCDVEGADPEDLVLGIANPEIAEVVKIKKFLNTYLYIRGLKEGTTTLNITYNGFTSKCKITVHDPSVKLSSDVVHVKSGKSKSVSLKGYKGKVTWTLLRPTLNSKVKIKKTGNSSAKITVDKSVNLGAYKFFAKTEEGVMYEGLLLITPKNYYYGNVKTVINEAYKYAEETYGLKKDLSITDTNAMGGKYYLYREVPNYNQRKQLKDEGWAEWYRTGYNVKSQANANKQMLDALKIEIDLYMMGHSDATSIHLQVSSCIGVMFMEDFKEDAEFYETAHMEYLASGGYDHETGEKGLYGGQDFSEDSLGTNTIFIMRTR